MKRFLMMSALLLASACTRPQRLQYDYSRSYAQAFNTQADLTRASVDDAIYHISGTEGILLRQNVLTETTDTESGTAEATE